MRRLALAVALLAAAPAAAQYTNPYTWRTFNNPISSSIDTILQQRMNRKLLENMIQRRLAGQGGSQAPNPAEAPPPRAPIAASDFKPAGPRQVPARVVASTPGLDAEGRKQLAEVFRQVFAAFEKEGRPNNVAYALAFVIGTSLQVGLGREVPDDDAERLALDLNDLLARSPEFAKMPAGQRQELYEGCVVTAGLIGVLHQVAEQQGDEALAGTAREMAKQVLQLFGAG
jgi:hypothetical protein